MIKEQQIAIIGAGISGLSAAHYLKLKGYSNIVMFESRDRVGGKISSVECEGRQYEIGGVFVQDSFAAVKELLAAYELSLGKKQALQTCVWSNKQLASNMALNREVFGLFKIIRDFYKLWKIMRNSQPLSNPQLAVQDVLFYQNLEKLARTEGIESIPNLVGPFVTGMGYGFTDKTPALYQLKLMKRAFGFAAAIEINNHFGTHIPGTYFVKGGYQSLLKKMAETCDIHLNASVEAMARNEGGVSLKVDGQWKHFNKVLIATPPSNTRNYLDMNEEEEFLLTTIRHYYFRSSLFLGKSLPRNKMVFFPESNQSDQLGKVNSLINWHPDKDYFSTYQLCDENTTTADLDAQLERTVTELGGSIDKMQHQETFNYFPHYLEPDLIKHRPYERLEALQGVNNTYYLGATVSAESVDDAVSYAKNLINQFF